MKRVTVFCASSDRIPDVYKQDAHEMGKLLAEAGYGLVYGGGALGTMGIVADEMLKAGAPVKGVIPRFMVEVEWQHKGVADMELTDTMSERKQRLIEAGDIVLVLAGGVGTLDEMFEAISDRKLDLNDKAMVVLNTAGLYTPIRDMMERLNAEGFLRDNDHLYFADTPREAIEKIDSILG
ncbi:MAG: TIGR00730 family Rossman fold protein [Bacteroidia bacterium]|nr:TIGR00730 family Rossman fold protein [Bacteroidia bacterium]